MAFMPQQPPQPYADSDRINAAFDNMGEDAYGGYTNDGMNGYGGMNGNGDMNRYHDDEEGDLDHEQQDLSNVAAVNHKGRRRGQGTKVPREG